MRLSIVGAGYVGLVTAACLAEQGHDCVCVDLDADKVDRINRGQAPIHEAGLDALLARHAGARLRATTDLARAVRDSDLTFIAVGTPFDGQRIDLGQVVAAARAIGAGLRDKGTYHAVIVKSTVVPGTTDEVVLPVLQQASGKRAGEDFGVGMNPEFLTEGVAVRDFLQPDRIVLGGIDARTIGVQRAVYAAFRDTPLLETNNKTAEMIKYASNAVLATLISFSNEIANLCSKLGGVDVADVMHGVHLARYFTTPLADGERHQAGITSFLWAGCGYGGSCLPKDTQALAAHGATLGAPMPLLQAVIDTNRRQPARMIALLERHFASLAGLRVTVLGVAFKEDTDDVRESPALPIVHALLERGAEVTVYDPVAQNNGRRLLPSCVRWADDLEQALAADAVMLVTRWREFERIPALLTERPAAPLLIDGRRMLPPDSVPRYEGIGR